MRITLTLVIVALAASSCADSQSGQSGKLRFGQVVQYAETKDFTAPIARGQEMKIAIQSATKNALLNDFAYLDGTLSILDSAGLPIDVTRDGAGKFKTIFPQVGVYTMHADAGSLTDSLSVTVAEPHHLRLARSPHNEVYTRDGSEDCSYAFSADAGVVSLRANQRLDAALVVADVDDRAMLGIIRLVSEELELTRYGATIDANLYIIAPKPGSTRTATISLPDTTVAPFSLAVSTELATCPPK